jgi:flagellar biosynthesis GTPase FlhF
MVPFSPEQMLRQCRPLRVMNHTDSTAVMSMMPQLAAAAAEAGELTERKMDELHVPGASRAHLNERPDAQQRCIWLTGASAVARRQARVLAAAQREEEERKREAEAAAKKAQDKERAIEEKKKKKEEEKKRKQQEKEQEKKQKQDEKTKKQEEEKAQRELMKRKKQDEQKESRPSKRRASDTSTSSSNHAAYEAARTTLTEKPNTASDDWKCANCHVSYFLVDAACNQLAVQGPTFMECDQCHQHWCEECMPPPIMQLHEKHCQPSSMNEKTMSE